MHSDVAARTPLTSHPTAAGIEPDAIVHIFGARRVSGDALTDAVPEPGPWISFLHRKPANRSPKVTNRRRDGYDLADD